MQAKLVKQEQQAIDALYEKKLKGAEVSQKMYVPLCSPHGVHLPTDPIILIVRGVCLLYELPSASSAHSTLTNKSRLKLLQQREEHLQDLFATAREAIDDLASDEARYVQFLEGIIVQGFLAQLEPEVTVHSREKDVEIAQRAADGAARQYNEISGRTVKPTLEGSLSDDM